MGSILVEVRATRKCTARYCITPDSPRFDEAAALAGIACYRALDLYVDRQIKATAERLHFTQTHLALSA